MTVTRLCQAAALAVDQTTKKDVLRLAVMVNEEATDDGGLQLLLQYKIGG